MPDPKLPAIDCLTIADFMRNTETCDHRETVEPNDELARILATPYTTPERMKRRKLTELRLRSRQHRAYSRMLAWAPVSLVAVLSLLATQDSDPFALCRFIAVHIAPLCWSLAILFRISARRTERIYRSHVRK